MRDSVELLAKETHLWPVCGPVRGCNRLGYYVFLWLVSGQGDTSLVTGSRLHF